MTGSVRKIPLGPGGSGPGPERPAPRDPQGPLARGKAWRTAALVALWLGAVGAGMLLLLVYSTRPCDAGAPAPRWPAGSRLPSPGRGAILVLAVHPRCACSRASVEELARIVARCGERLAVRVLMFKPAGESDDWARTDLWRSVAAIPGVDLRIDEGGAEARRFGAATSGQALLYDASGRLVFSGGITWARGHSGDNAGRDAIVGWVEQGTALRRSTFVFGCSLHDPGLAAAVGGK